MKTSRVIGYGLSLALSSGILAAPAMAEGGYNTYIRGWWTGAESSRWSDKNLDSNQTVIAFYNCQWTHTGSKFSGYTVSLRQDVFGPDRNHGSKNGTCDISATWWGDGSAGKYFFRLVKIAGHTSTTEGMNAGRVWIGW